MAHTDTAKLGTIGSLKLTGMDPETGMIHVKYSGPVPMRRIMGLVADMCATISEIERPHRGEEQDTFSIEVKTEACDKKKMKETYDVFVLAIQDLLKRQKNLSHELCRTAPSTIALAVHAEATGYEVS